MSELRVVAERAMGAPAEVVYRCIADFDRHHPRFLPPAFSAFRVEEGRVGAGTVHGFKLIAGGRARTFRMGVAEPEPGRVMTESDERSSMVTTWVVTPEGPGCQVRVESRWQSAGGIGGVFERLVAPRVLRRLYADELERLDRYAARCRRAEPNPADGHQRANASRPTATALSSRSPRPRPPRRGSVAPSSRLARTDPLTLPGPRTERSRRGR